MKALRRWDQLAAATQEERRVLAVLAGLSVLGLSWVGWEYLGPPARAWAVAPAVAGDAVADLPGPAGASALPGGGGKGAEVGRGAPAGRGVPVGGDAAAGSGAVSGPGGAGAGEADGGAAHGGGLAGAAEGLPGGPVAEAPGPVVYVAGAVKKPGVYGLPPGARVEDALQAAGGPTEQAAVSWLNLAAYVADAQRIYVPSQDEVAGQPMPGTGAGTAAGAWPGALAGGAGANPRLDLNRASAAQLESLPGVGPVLASKIVRYREQHGPFRSLDELLDVPGIGDKTLQELRDYLMVR